MCDTLETIALSHGNRAQDLIKQLYEIASISPDNSLLLTKSISEEATFNYVQVRIDTLLTHTIKEQLKKIPSASFENALLTYSLALQYYTVGDYSEAFTEALQALEEFKHYKDNKYKAKTLKLLGRICTNINLFNLGEEYLNEALSYHTPEDFAYYEIKQNLSNLYYYSQQYDMAINSLMALIKPLEERGFYGLLAVVHLNIGSAYYFNGNTEEAFLYWQKTEQLLKEMNNPHLTGILFMNYGVYTLNKKQDLHKTLEYFKRAEEIIEKSGISQNSSILYLNIAKIYELLGDVDNELIYLKKHLDLDSRFIPNIKAVEAYQHYILNFLEISENKLIMAEQQIEIKNKQVTVIVVIAISIILFITLLLLLLQQQKRKKEQKNKELMAEFERKNRELGAQLKHENKIKELEKERQKELVESKTREISTYSMLLSNKNDILDQISKLNDQLFDSQTNTGLIANKINKIIQSNFNIDQEWEDFKAHFEKVHPSFFDKLKNICNELTEDNLKICAYFKMGMTTKQIAQLLHITPASVNTHRYRLRKKIGLSEAEDLDSFIRNI